MFCEVNELTQMKWLHWVCEEVDAHAIKVNDNMYSFLEHLKLIRKLSTVFHALFLASFTN